MVQARPGQVPSVVAGVSLRVFLAGRVRTPSAATACWVELQRPGQAGSVEEGASNAREMAQRLGQCALVARRTAVFLDYEAVKLANIMKDNGERRRC